MGGDQKTGRTAAEQAKQEKADQRAKALRDNLHRRKAQARARKSAAIGTVEIGMTENIKTNDSSKGDGKMTQSRNPDLTPESKGY